jgi:hypothetical protein
MAIDFGRVARGVATGYLTAKVADTAAQDDLNREFILQARNQYFNVDKPNFIADEKKRSANIDFISTKLSPVYANYADANNITLSDVNTRDFISSINDLSNEDKFKLESTITQRKKERTQTFDEKNKFITDQFANLPGGPGSMNITSMFFPNEGQDIAEVGVKQDVAPTTEMKSIMEIEGTGGMYDFNNTAHRQLERIGATQFNQLFFDRNTQRFNFAISGDKNKQGDFVDSRYPTVQLLKQGYADAVKQGYEFGFEVYARDKFIQLVMDSRGIKGYTGTLPPETPAVEAPAAAAAATTTETKAVPEDGKKFDAFDTSQIGVKEDAKVNIKSLRTVEGGGTSSAAVVINDLRDIIARISDSPSLSDDEKSKRIDIARSRAKERLEAMGLDPDNFNL